jgi:hypothetical protein
MDATRRASQTIADEVGTWPGVEIDRGEIGRARAQGGQPSARPPARRPGGPLQLSERDLGHIVKEPVVLELDGGTWPNQMITRVITNGSGGNGRDGPGTRARRSDQAQCDAGGCTLRLTVACKTMDTGSIPVAASRHPGRSGQSEVAMIGAHDARLVPVSSGRRGELRATRRGSTTPCAPDSSI